MANLLGRFYNSLFADSIPMPTTTQPANVQKGFFSNAWTVLTDSFNGFMDDRCLKLSAALAYYTIFSLAPLLVLIMSLASIFLGEEAIQGQIFGQINGLVGNEAAKQIQDMIKSVGLSGKTNTALIDRHRYAGDWRDQYFRRNSGFGQSDLAGKSQTKTGLAETAQGPAVVILVNCQPGVFAPGVVGCERNRSGFEWPANPFSARTWRIRSQRY